MTMLRAALVLGLLSALGPFAIDMYQMRTILPATNISYQIIILQSIILKTLFNTLPSVETG